MRSKYMKNYKEYTDKELRNLIIQYARLGLEASPAQIVKVMSESKISQKIVYDVIRKNV